MFDLLIRGDRVVTPQGAGAYDITVQGEKIVAMAALDTFSADSARRVIDARGKIVIPGGVDPHIHSSWALSYLDGTPFQSAPPSVISRAALHGGTTTLIDFARWQPGETVQATLERRDEDFARQCYCDYAYHILIKGDLPTELFGQLAEAIRAGYPTIKIFTTNSRPGRQGFMVDFGDI